MKNETDKREKRTKEQKRKQMDFPRNWEKQSIWSELDWDVVLFLVVGFALRDFIQSFIEDLLVPASVYLLQIPNNESACWNGIAYGHFLYSVFSFALVCCIVWILFRFHS